MAYCGQLTRMHLAVVVVLVGVALSRAEMFFNGGERKEMMLGESPDFEREGGDEGGDLLEEGRGEERFPSGLETLRQNQKAIYPRLPASTFKRSWLPGTQTGLFGKRAGHWVLAVPEQMAKRQGRFGKRGLVGAGPDRLGDLARWTVKRSTEGGSNFERQRKGGVPHVFKTGGLFGKRSADNWADKFE